MGDIPHLHAAWLRCPFLCPCISCLPSTPAPFPRVPFSSPTAPKSFSLHPPHLQFSAILAGLLSPDLPGGLPGATALREAGHSHRAGWPLPAFQTHSARLHFDNTVVVIFRTLRTFFTNEYVFGKGFLYIDWLPSGVQSCSRAVSLEEGSHVFLILNNYLAG